MVAKERMSYRKAGLILEQIVEFALCKLLTPMPLLPGQFPSSSKRVSKGRMMSQLCIRLNFMLKVP